MCLEMSDYFFIIFMKIEPPFSQDIGFLRMTILILIHMIESDSDNPQSFVPQYCISSHFFITKTRKMPSKFPRYFSQTRR